VNPEQVKQKFIQWCGISILRISIACDIRSMAYPVRGWRGGGGEGCSPSPAYQLVLNLTDSDKDRSTQVTEEYVYNVDLNHKISICQTMIFWLTQAIILDNFEQLWTTFQSLIYPF
jgi:hypothetical protein